jgi:hypothetical protein
MKKKKIKSQSSLEKRRKEISLKIDSRASLALGYASTSLVCSLGWQPPS